MRKNTEVSLSCREQTWSPGSGLKMGNVHRAENCKKKEKKLKYRKRELQSYAEASL